LAPQVATIQAIDRWLSVLECPDFSITIRRTSGNYEQLYTEMKNDLKASSESAE
jgi:hypothetical protein